MQIIENIDPDNVKKINLWHRFEELAVFRAGLNNMVDINRFS